MMTAYASPELIDAVVNGTIAEIKRGADGTDGAEKVHSALGLALAEPFLRTMLAMVNETTSERAKRDLVNGFCITAAWMVAQAAGLMAANPGKDMAPVAKVAGHMMGRIQMMVGELVTDPDAISEFIPYESRQ